MIGISHPMLVSNELLDSAKSNSIDALKFITKWGHSNTSHIGQNINPGIWLIGSAMKLLQSSKAGVLYADLYSIVKYNEGKNNFDNILCPTLVICGTDDMMTPHKNTTVLLDNIKKAKKVLISHCGHMAMIEQPDKVRSEISLFLNNLNSFS